MTGPSFHRTYHAMLAAFGKSESEVALLSGIDRAYIRRLCSGEKLTPSPEVLCRLWMAIIFDRAVLEARPDLVHGFELFITSAVTTMATSKALGRS